MTEQIKTLRKQKRLSREKLASLCGVTSGTIYRAEKTGKITLSNYQKILNTLNDDHNTSNHNGNS